MLWLLVSEGGRGETGWVRGFLQFPTGVGSGVGLTVASTTAELSRESGYVHEGTDSRGEGGQGLAAALLAVASLFPGNPE